MPEILILIMEEKTELELKKVQTALQRKHPNWSQAKTRWIAMQALGILGWR